MTAMQQRVDPRPVKPPILGLVASANSIVEGGDDFLNEPVNDTVDSETELKGPRDLVSGEIDVPGSTPRADIEITSDGSRVHWIRGFSYRPEVCNGGDIIAWDGGSVGTPPSIEGQIDVAPYIVEGVDKRSTFGTPHGANGHNDELEGRQYARRQLLACESKQMEKELWTGKLTDGTLTGNHYLADSHAVLLEGDRTIGYLTALGALERAIGDNTCGAQGMIHARRDLVSLWDAGGALRRVGSLILTINDTIVVPGSGYDGSAPRGALHEDPAHSGVVPSTDSSWAYATSVVDIRRGAFFDPETILERLDTSLNVLTTYERRPAASTWGCLQVAVHADHVLDKTTTGS